MSSLSLFLGIAAVGLARNHGHVDMGIDEPGEKASTCAVVFPGVGGELPWVNGCDAVSRNEDIMDAPVPITVDDSNVANEE